MNIIALPVPARVPGRPKGTTFTHMVEGADILLSILETGSEGRSRPSKRPGFNPPAPGEGGIGRLYLTAYTKDGVGIVGPWEARYDENGGLSRDHVLDSLLSGLAALLPNVPSGLRSQRSAVRERDTEAARALAERIRHG